MRARRRRETGFERSLVAADVAADVARPAMKGWEAKSRQTPVRFLACPFVAIALRLKRSAWGDLKVFRVVVKSQATGPRHLSRRLRPQARRIAADRGAARAFRSLPVGYTGRDAVRVGGASGVERAGRRALGRGRLAARGGLVDQGGCRPRKFSAKLGAASVRAAAFDLRVAVEGLILWSSPGDVKIGFDP